MSSHPIAVLCSDLHLTLLPPACRKDKDWMAVQAHYLRQLKEWNLPVVCAGDIFDKWNAAPELINFALEHLPDEMICVPGQHDLPLHRIDLMHRSGYGVLKQAGKIKDIGTAGAFKVTKTGLCAYGFGWNEEITPLGERVAGTKMLVHLAVIHKYCWMDDKKYPGAPEDAELPAFRKSLKGYDAAVFGDNHQHFTAKVGDCSVLNSGGFIRRKSDEVDYEPGYGLLMSDGTIKRKRLDTSIDVFHAVDQKREEVPFNMKEFIDGLESLGESGLDFKEAVSAHLKTEKLDTETKEIILTALEK